MLTFGIQFYFNTDTMFLIWFLSSLFFLIIFNSPLYAYYTVLYVSGLSFLIVFSSFPVLVPPYFNCYSYVICLVNWDSDCQVVWVLKLAQNLGKNTEACVLLQHTQASVYFIIKYTPMCKNNPSRANVHPYRPVLYDFCWDLDGDNTKSINDFCKNCLKFSFLLSYIILYNLASAPPLHWKRHKFRVLVNHDC